MNIKAAITNLFIAIRERFTYDSPALHDDCEEFEVNNWIISRFVVRRLVPVVGVHPFSLPEQMLMVAAVCRLKPTHIFEWGTNIGKSARIFYETCRTFGIPAEIHSVDLPDDVEHGEHPKRNRGMLVKGRKGVHLHRGDGLETSLLILSEKPAALRPLFFLDGDHEYASVKRELEGIIRSVPYANVLLHDTFYQSPAAGYNIGPYQAIEDVLKSMPNNFKLLAQNSGLPGMTLLWQKQDQGKKP
jgi:cephalosporin hydroxylase